MAARGDKVYVDYLQNGRGKLIAAPFSVRPRPRRAGLDAARLARGRPRASTPARFTHPHAPARASRSRGDPLRGVLGPGIDAVRLLEGLARRLEARGRRARAAA